MGTFGAKLNDQFESLPSFIVKRINVVIKLEVDLHLLASNVNALTHQMHNSRAVLSKDAALNELKKD